MPCGDVACQEGAFVLGIGDVQHVCHRLGGGVVDPDETLIGVLRRDGFHIVEFPAHQNHHIGRVCRVVDLLGVILIFALNGLDLDAFGSQLVAACLGGVVERTVTESTGNHQRNGQI